MPSAAGEAPVLVDLGPAEAIEPAVAAWREAVLLDRRNVFLGIGLVDITDQAIGRIDAEVGDGSE